MRGHKTDRKVEMLGKVSLLSACSAKELKRIAALADEVDVAAGKVLAAEGRPGHEFFLIADGKVEVTLRGRKLATLGPGDFFGEMALIARQPRAATVTATEPTALFVVSNADFSQFIRENPEVTLKILRGVAERLRALEKAPTY